VLKTDGMMVSASGLTGFGTNRKAKRRKKDKSEGGEVTPPPRTDP
jgi:hypothetical protein